MLLLIQPVTWHGCAHTALRGPIWGAASVSLQTAAHLCSGPPLIRHREWLYLSGAKDNTGGEASDRGPTGGDGRRADEGKDTNQMEKVMQVCVCEPRRREWQSDGGNTIKGNECHSVIPGCMIQGAFANYPDSQRSAPSLLSTGREDARLQCQTLALLQEPLGMAAPTGRSSLFSWRDARPQVSSMKDGGERSARSSRTQLSWDRQGSGCCQDKLRDN